MTQNEIRERLLELSRVRLKTRLGGFEQFRLTLEDLPTGSAILAHAGLMPEGWKVGLKMGLDEAAKQIDLHLLSVIDSWAQKNMPARQISVLEGLVTLPFNDGSKKTAPLTQTASLATLAPQKPSSRIHSTKARRNFLTPVIEFAQERCRDPNDTAEVWGVLLVLAEIKHGPLRGATEEGLQYFSKGSAGILTKNALAKRISR